ncbi:MAG: hypothetical protein OEV42_06535 [Deltaproteobacteria bacterium]|nr:hypothetical protein [Deltaproteobacteria bacterium]
MSLKEIVAVLMESPYYFTVPLRTRLKEVKLILKYGRPDARLS